jgi:hypothetical protein
MIPVFIGGTGRSGTTVLKNVLSCHLSVVSLPVELRVLVDPDGAIDLVSALSDQWSPYHADAALQKFRCLMLACGRPNSTLLVLAEKIEKMLFRFLNVSPRGYLGMGFVRFFGREYYHQRLDDLIQELCHHITKGSWIGSPSFQIPNRIQEITPISKTRANKILSRFFDDLYAQVAKEKETHWIDDTPYNLLRVTELLQMFPDMRFIHICRDPRDVMASYYRHKWGGDDFVAISRRLESIYSYWFEIREQLPENCFKEIKLESLAREPLRELESICEFTGLDFQKNLLATPLSLEKVHAGRWREDVPAGNWEKVHPHLDPFIEAFGYVDD